MADRVATRGERTPPQSLARHFRIARDVFGDAPGAPRRLLRGDEVMTLLGLAEGAEVGRALDVLQEEIDCGLVTTAEQARAFLRAGGSASRKARAMPELPEVETVRRRLAALPARARPSTTWSSTTPSSRC